MKRTMNLRALLPLTVLLPGLAHSQEADLVLRNGNFWTVDNGTPRAEAVAILDGALIYVGDDLGVTEHVGRKTKSIDLKGKFALPGFNDNHVHFESTGKLLYGLNLLDVAGQKNFVKRIREVNKRYTPGTWITGGDWSAYETWSADDVSKAGRQIDPDDPYGNLFTPNKSMIDGFTKNRPVLVRRFDHRVYLANSKALELVGISANTANPEGVIVERDEMGKPTGILKNPLDSSGVESTMIIRDNVAEFFASVIPPPSREQQIQETLRTWEQMAQVGVTSYSDVTSSPRQLDIYRELREQSLQTARVRFRPSLETAADMSRIGIRIGFGDEWIRLGSVKAWIDGIMGNSTARFYETYAHNPDSRGIWRDIMFPFMRDPDNAERMQSRLERLALEADKSGIQLTVHAIGDQANGYLLDMLERIIAKNGDKDRRFRLVHAQVMTPEDIARAGRLGIIVEMQPYHCSDDMRWMEERIGAERSKGAYAFRSLWEAGAVVSFGTDSPGTNASRYYLNPMLGLYSAVTRQTLAGEPEGGWFPEERITIEQAIKAYTLNTAYAAFEDTIKGSLTVGKLADIVVFSDNLLDIAPIKIKDVTVEYTIVGGQVIYKK